MRGFEVTWTDLSGLLYDPAYCEEREDYSAISWLVVGRFKCKGGEAGCYMIPIAGTTTKSGIKFFTWTQRFVASLLTLGIDSGWAFRRSDGD